MFQWKLKNGANNLFRGAGVVTPCTTSPAKVAANDPSTWIPVTTGGDQDGVPGFRLESDLTQFSWLLRSEPVDGKPLSPSPSLPPCHTTF